MALVKIYKLCVGATPKELEDAVQPYLSMNGSQIHHGVFIQPTMNLLGVVELIYCQGITYFEEQE